MNRFILLVLLGAVAAPTEFIFRAAAQVPVRVRPVPPSSGMNPFGAPGTSAPSTTIPGLAAATAPSRYIDATYHTPAVDANGTAWRIQPDGSVDIEQANVGHSGNLQVNGLSFSTLHQRMTPDGREYLHTGRCGTIEVMRLTKLDLAGQSARFIDVFTNPGTSELRDVSVAVLHNCRNNYGLRTEVGDPAGPATLDARASGLVAVPAQSHQPMIATFVASRQAKLRPSLNVNNPRSYQAVYRLTIPAGGSVVLVSGIRLYRSVNAPAAFQVPAGMFVGNQPPSAVPHADPKELAAALAPFNDKSWLKDMPPDVRRKIVNHVDPLIDYGFGGLPKKPLEDLLHKAGLAAGDVDILKLEDETTVRGTAVCGPIKVATKFGPAEVALGDVAAIVGGAGQDRTMQVYLRNGEILVGAIETGTFTLVSNEGLAVDLVPALMNLLVLKSDPDGPVAPPPAFLTTVTGDRFGVRIRPDDRLSAATPWGAFSASFGNVEGLVHRPDPQPMLRLALRNGTQLPIFLTGPALEWESIRYGKITLPHHALRRWDRAISDEREGDVVATAASQASVEPHVRMGDDTVVFGNLVETQLRIATGTGVKTIDARRVLGLTRQDDGTFLCHAVDMPLVIGRLVDPQLTVVVNGMRLRIPAQHVEGYRGVAAGEGPSKN